MKSVVLILLAAWVLISAVPAPGAEPAVAPGPVYVIPVKGMIERGLVYVVRRGVEQALRQHAAAIVFDMDTPGGRLDAAEEILKIVGDLPMPVITFVNPSAISAGAILAMGTDTIYMSPGSRIGDAMPLLMSPLGGAQEMPEDMAEKAVSYTASLIRSAAERKGHDPQLAEKMVRREIEYKVGDDVIGKEGQLLTLTNREAERRVTRDGKEVPLLSRGTVASLQSLLEELGMKGHEVVELRVALAEKIARWIEAFSVLFLVGGLLGIYIEFKTPGFGLPGILGGILLAIWFWGHHVAGLAGMGEILLFLIGLVLLGVEIFVIPGFGLTGIAGILLIMLSLLLAMVQHYPGMPWYQPSLDGLQQGIINLGATLALLFGSAVFLARYLPANPAFRKLVLASTTSADAGFKASTPKDGLIGLTGTAATPLRPGGIGQFGDRRIDVVARGEFIEKETPIVIHEVHGMRVVVDKV